MLLALVAACRGSRGGVRRPWQDRRARPPRASEAPLIADDPAADNTDVYAFVSPDKPSTVTIIANYYPFQDPGG